MITSYATCGYEMSKVISSLPRRAIFHFINQIAPGRAKETRGKGLKGSATFFNSRSKLERCSDNIILFFYSHKNISLSFHALDLYLICDRTVIYSKEVFSLHYIILQILTEFEFQFNHIYITYICYLNLLYIFFTAAYLITIKMRLKK